MLDEEQIVSPFELTRKGVKRESCGVDDLRLSLAILVALDCLPETFTLSQVIQLLPGWGKYKVLGQLHTLKQAGFLKHVGRSWRKAEYRFWFWLYRLEERVSRNG